MGKQTRTEAEVSECADSETRQKIDEEVRGNKIKIDGEETNQRKEGAGLEKKKGVSPQDRDLVLINLSLIEPQHFPRPSGYQCRLLSCLLRENGK